MICESSLTLKEKYAKCQYLENTSDKYMPLLLLYYFFFYGSPSYEKWVPGFYVFISASIWCYFFGDWELSLSLSLSLALMNTGFSLVALSTANSLPHGAENKAE